MMFETATAEIVGAVVSSVIVSVAVEDQFPAVSMNCAETVLVPAPVVSVHDAVGAKGIGALKDEVLEKRIIVTALTASVAVTFNVTVVTFVAAAPLLMRTVPVGA